MVAVDFSYKVDGGEPVIRVKAGEEVRIVFENRGQHDHEFLLVQDREGALKTVKEALERGASDAELDRLKAGIAFGGVRHEVEPGSVTIFRLRFGTPGVYYFLCLESDPEEIPHAERGELGQIIVEG